MWSLLVVSVAYGRLFVPQSASPDTFSRNTAGEVAQLQPGTVHFGGFQQLNVPSLWDSGSVVVGSAQASPSTQAGYGFAVGALVAESGRRPGGAAS